MDYMQQEIMKIISFQCPTLDAGTDGKTDKPCWANNVLNMECFCWWKTQKLLGMLSPKNK